MQSKLTLSLDLLALSSWVHVVITPLASWLNLNPDFISWNLAQTIC